MFTGKWLLKGRKHGAKCPEPRTWFLWIGTLQSRVKSSASERLYFLTQAVVTYWGCHKKTSSPRMSCQLFGEPMYFKVAMENQKH